MRVPYEGSGEEPTLRAKFSDAELLRAARGARVLWVVPHFGLRSFTSFRMTSPLRHSERQRRISIAARMKSHDQNESLPFCDSTFFIELPFRLEGKPQAN